MKPYVGSILDKSTTAEVVTALLLGSAAENPSDMVAIIDALSQGHAIEVMRGTDELGLLAYLNEAAQKYNILEFIEIGRALDILS